MGWNPFESETEITVATSVSRVLENKNLPNSIKSGLVAGIFQEEEQLVETIMEEMVSSIGTRVERMYQFGKKKYVYGVPSSAIMGSDSARELVERTLETIEGVPVSIEYYHYGALNNLHYGWQYLISEYGYNPSTNELVTLSTQKGAKVYLANMQVVVKNITATERANASLEQWGTPPTAGYTPLRPTQLGTLGVSRSATPIGVEPTTDSDYFRVSCVWLVDNVPNSEEITFPMAVVNPNLGYFQVKYKVGTVSKYWTYDDGIGTWPALDEAFTARSDDLGTFFPFAHFRHARRSLADDKGTAAYKSSEKLLKYLGMDYGTIAESINHNPQIAEVESALMMLAVPADSSIPIEERYLYDFFTAVYIKTGGANAGLSMGSQYVNSLFYRVAQPQISIVIQDRHFKMTVSIGQLFKSRKAGRVAKVGEYTNSTGNIYQEKTGIKYKNQQDKVGEKYSYTVTIPCRFFRHQISAGFYEEIAASSISTSYHVWGEYSVSGSFGERNLLIPLDHQITENYNAKDRELLYARSLHYVINSKHEEEIEWYEQDWFKWALAVVAVVITIFSWGTAGPAMAATLAAATASIEAFAMTMLLTALKYLIFKVVFKLFVKMVGAEAAMVLAVVAACYGLTSNMVGTFGVEGAPWASELLQVSTGLINSVADSFTQELLDLKEESDLFGLYAKEQMQLLESANKLLENDNLLSPFVLFGEKPSEYYDRTVHSGNVGVFGIASISSYVSNALTLPEISQTLGNNLTEGNPMQL